MALSADAVVEAILLEAESRGIVVHGLKLQKLLFYAQGYHLALTEQPLFADKIEAWDSGPVVPTVWRSLKGTEGPFAPSRRNLVLHQTAMLALALVFADLGRCSGEQLKQLTHKPRTPWSFAYAHSRNAEIELRSMREFFQREGVVERAKNTRPALLAHFQLCAPLDVDDAEWAAITKRLDSPANPSDRLVRFLSTPSVLENGQLDALLTSRFA